MKNNEFHTLRGYDQIDKPELSTSMEDYLEMICRLSQKQEYVRVNQLAQALHVTPPSSSKMMLKLKGLGYVEYEPYGIIRLTKKGQQTGNYLLKRHDILHRFFCNINKTEHELELVEKIEHFFDRRTIENLEKVMESERNNML